MKSFSKPNFKGGGALAIVFSSFFTALKVFDYFDWPRPAQHVAALPHTLPDVSIDITTMSKECRQIAAGVAVARAPADKAGTLLFGPYVHLLPGSYGLYIRFTCADNQKVNVMDVTASARSADAYKNPTRTSRPAL